MSSLINDLIEICNLSQRRVLWVCLYVCLETNSLANYHAHTSPKLLFGDDILNAFGNLRVYNELFLKNISCCKKQCLKIIDNYISIW